MLHSQPAGETRSVMGLPLMLVVAVSLLLGLVVVLYVAAQTVAARSFERIETQDVLEGVSRAQTALDNMGESLLKSVTDYAQWDDAAGFVRGTYPNFLDDNALPDVMANLSIDFMVVIGADQEARAGRALSGAREVRATDRGLLEDLAPSRIERAYDPRTASGSGLLTLGGTTYLIATTPITDTAGSPAGGAYLVFGRLLDDAVASEMQRLSRLPVDLTLIDTSSSASARPRGGADARVSVELLNEGQARGSTVLYSIDGFPVARLGVVVPRTAHVVGQRALGLLRYALLAFGLVSCFSVGYVVLRQDREVLKRQEAEAIARRSEQAHLRLIQSMADAVIGMDAYGVILFTNSQAEQLFGLSKDEIQGRSVSGFLTVEGWARVEKRFGSLELLRSMESFEVDVLRASGRTVPVEVNASLLELDGPDSSGVQWIARDITERRRFEQELVYLANRDHLTGLYNRRRFEEELARQVAHAQRSGRAGALLWMDVDFFKDINDSLGHQAGDQVLIGVSATVQSELRGDSFLARLGGDEFGVILPETNQHQAGECATRLIEAIRAATYTFGERPLRVTTSMGVVIFPEQGSTVEELVARADLAMYHAKEDGRDGCRVYEPGEGWEAEQRVRFDWAAQIERALDKDLFVVYAQPVVSLADGRVDRHELLIRMEGEDGSIVPPSTFLPVAERTGLIHQIDQWMVRRAIDLISMRAGRDADYKLDINLSGRAFSDGRLLRLIESELIRTGIEPASFGVELTETAAVTDMGKAREFIAALRNMGCRVSLDDFGSGFSSFYYLKNLPVDSLKIDGSFVQNLCQSRQDQHVVRAMVELSQGFGVSSTAEFVEDEATLELLKSLGVTYAQGYHISRPMPVSEVRHSHRRAELGATGS